MKFGGTAGTIVSDTATLIVATSPPGPAGLVVNVTVTTAGGTSAVSAADKFSYLTPHELFIYNVYELLFNRAPDPGAAVWINLLDAGVAPSAVVLDIEQAPGNEYQTHVVISLYQHYLGRTLDPGSQNWVNQLAGGVSIESVTASILASPEYFADKGGTNAGYVNGLYTDVLGRSADSAGFNGWLAALNSGAFRARKWRWTFSPRRNTAPTW